MSRPEPITLSAEDGEAIIARLSVYAPTRSDCEILIPVGRLYFWLIFALQEAKLSLRRLRNLLFGKGPKPKEPLAAKAQTASSEVPGQEAGGEAAAQVAEVASGLAAAGRAAGSQSPPGDVSPTPQGGHRAGTGRLGADAYVHAERVEGRHEDLAPGQRCPVGGQGTLYELPPGVEIRIDGHALLSAMRYELHKLRCAACGQIFTASLPSEAGVEKDSPRARAVLVVGRSYLGLPFYRIEGYQARLGGPVPDATQGDQSERVGACCDVVFELLETLAAQGELMHHADTSVRILTLIKENQQIRADAAAPGWSRPKERIGMCTTALVVRVGERLIALYDSGRAPAGENLAPLLEQREATQEPP